MERGEAAIAGRRRSQELKGCRKCCNHPGGMTGAFQPLTYPWQDVYRPSTRHWKENLALTSTPRSLQRREFV